MKEFRLVLLVRTWAFLASCFFFLVRFLVPCTLVVLVSCDRIDLYEKTVTIPHHSWQGSYRPTFTFTISDTSRPYEVFVTLRHSDKYNYRNIYINLITKQPGADSSQSARFDLPLGSDDEGWMGSGMDDIYDHRIALTPPGQPFYFRKPGDYQFTIEQVMREDPLQNVMNVGIRLEKK
jgi:gliding motility-associated lipoprotein GldH